MNEHMNNKYLNWNNAVLFFVIFMMTFGVILSYKEMMDEEKAGYIVTYYTVSGQTKVYDPVHRLHRNSDNNGVSFIYNGKKVELIGNVEIVRK